jgi:salicylate hydroxylase
MAATVNDEDTEWGRAMEQQPSLPKDAGCNSASRHDESKEEESVEIAIIGGGLVGLAVAIGLVEKLGGDIRIKVYERAPQLRSSSQGMFALRPNGMTALDAIHPNLMEKVRETGSEMSNIWKTVIDAEGVATDTKMNAGDASVSKYGRQSVGIAWHNMQRILASLLPNNNNNDEHAIIKTNHSLQSFHEEEDSVLLNFDNGSVVRAKVVLACDGLFSAARRQVVTDEANDDSPIFFGQLNWGTIVKTSQLPPNLQGDEMKNTARVILHEGDARWMSMINDCGSDATFWQIRLNDPEKVMALSGNQGRGGLGLPGAKEKLLAVVAETCDDVASVIDAIPEEQIFERSIVGRYPLKTWLSRPNSNSNSTGRLVLVGDAAHGMHPNIGQGANQGFVSAASVVDMIDKVDKSYRKGDGDNDYRTALANFERHRKPRADLVQTYANAMGVLQATGQQVLPQEEMRAMSDWILRNEEGESAPVAVVEFLKTFEPCDHAGVSKLW